MVDNAERTRRNCPSALAALALTGLSLDLIQLALSMFSAFCNKFTFHKAAHLSPSSCWKYKAQFVFTSSHRILAFSFSQLHIGHPPETKRFSFSPKQQHSINAILVIFTAIHREPGSSREWPWQPSCRLAETRHQGLLQA